MLFWSFFGVRDLKWHGMCECVWTVSGICMTLMDYCPTVDSRNITDLLEGKTKKGRRCAYVNQPIECWSKARTWWASMIAPGKYKLSSASVVVFRVSDIQLWKSIDTVWGGTSLQDDETVLYICYKCVNIKSHYCNIKHNSRCIPLLQMKIPRVSSLWFPQK